MNEIEISSYIASFTAVLYIIIRYMKELNLSGEIRIFGYVITFQRVQPNEDQSNTQGNNDNNNNNVMENEVELHITSV